MLSRELSRFPLVGLTAVVIDYAGYRLIAAAGLGPDIAKAASFIAGALFAYVANRTYTFEAAHSNAAFARFWLIYLMSLGLNVGANALMLFLLQDVPAGTIISFLIATALSAATNFIGMKFLVFTRAAP